MFEGISVGAVESESASTGVDLEEFVDTERLGADESERGASMVAPTDDDIDWLFTDLSEVELDVKSPGVTDGDADQLDGDNASSRDSGVDDEWYVAISDPSAPFSAADAEIVDELFDALEARVECERTDPNVPRTADASDVDASVGDELEAVLESDDVGSSVFDAGTLTQAAPTVATEKSVDERTAVFDPEESSFVWIRPQHLESVD